MFRKSVLSSILTLGLFVGACDMTSLYPGVSQSLGLNVFELDKTSLLMSDPDEPPIGVKDPPGKVQ